MANDFFTEVMLYMASYLGIILIMFRVLAWMMAGLLGPFLRVKTSAGKLVLVKVKTVTQDYFKAGKIDKGFLVFKDKAKEERRISIPTELVQQTEANGVLIEKKVQAKVIYRSMGVNVVDVDDEKNAINTIDYAAVPGFDAVKYNHLYLRALYRPSILDKQEKIMLLLIVVILGIVVLEAFTLYDLSSKVTQLGQVSAAVTGGP